MNEGGYQPNPQSVRPEDARPPRDGRSAVEKPYPYGSQHHQASYDRGYKDGYRDAMRELEAAHQRLCDMATSAIELAVTPEEYERIKDQLVFAGGTE